MDDVLPVIAAVRADTDGDDGVQADLANHVCQSGYYVRLKVAADDGPARHPEVLQ